MSDSDLDLVWRGDVLRVLREHGMTDADPAVRALLALPAVVRDIGPVPRDRDADTATAKKALDDYLAGRQDSRGNPTPAPAECPASAPAKCKACDGSRRQKCQKCGGPEHGAREGCPAIMARAPKCPRCAGFGLLGGAVPSTCVYCHGTGRRS